MRYYAHYGHSEFILCSGYRGDLIRRYFLDYDEELTNDFTLYGTDGRRELHSRDLDDWNDGEELVEKPFRRLVDEGGLAAFH